MLLPKGGVNWKAARARLPPSRAIWHFCTRTRFPLFVAIAGLIVLLWRGLSGTAGEMQRFVCWGPSKSPMDMTANERAQWTAHLQTPVIFNHHAPVEVNSTTIERVDLNPVKSTSRALVNEERVLILTPLRDAAFYLPKYFDLLSDLSYPHHLIDLGFLVSDTTDDTVAVLAKELERIQKNEAVAFHSAMIVEKDFGVETSQDVEYRHSFAAQGPRRKTMGRARNYLLSSTMKPEHSWVYWRDVDIVDSPKKIIEDFVAHDRDVIVPNIWFHRYREKDGKMVDIEGRFDYNSWVESDTGRRLAASLDPDVVLAEGYKEYKTERTYMARMGDWRENKDEEIELDGIGGVNILVKGDVHRSGINFPCYAFENQAETEGFAKMAKRAGYGVYGLPNYVVWHIDTEEKPGNA
ncbi:glycosyltransferase family 62 protein [Aplosporella prunicola CBS 121167]|uniref:Glycosyltransferase family 62 protein n=1 Tax=Aplosporella prunicola CBS 121167 TaxID=1176127 RepID=A0A6A6BGR7_9PEZI|nr:glycosyltransferase family 62 protein [Aplosporella prunicola CBS 121167]KAF2142464.1 glycosyltransferase family 62 protein [Aplosporella prunicola CBS 121167]